TRSVKRRLKNRTAAYPLATSWGGFCRVACVASGTKAAESIGAIAITTRRLTEPNWLTLASVAGCCPRKALLEIVLMRAVPERTALIRFSERKSARRTSNPNQFMAVGITQISEIGAIRT